MENHSTEHPEKFKVKLSCEQCQQRKTKCDKAHPCGSCQRSGLDCTSVLRRRLPRGRTGTAKTRNAELKGQIARLEDLLSGFISGAGHAVTSSHASTSTCTYGTPVHIEEQSTTGGPPENDLFWSAINDRVMGIREVLENEFPNDDVDSSGEAIDSANMSTAGFDIVLFGVSSCSINPSITTPPAGTVIYSLFSIYSERVDPIFKVMHVPSLRKLLLSDEGDFSKTMDTPAFSALKFAIYFAAVCALNEIECRDKLSESKDLLGNKFRLATEVLLSIANLQGTKDITTLQAFAIYIAARRAFSGHRNASLLVASAIRIGQKIGLDVEEGHTQRPFQLEMRRRLWYSICILDMQTSFDTGSRAAIVHNGLICHPPLNINDADIYPSLEDPPVQLPGITDMTFSSMAYDAMLCWRRLTHVYINPEGQPGTVTQDLSHRAGIVEDWERNLRSRHLNYCDTSQPFQSFTNLVGEGMIVTMQLLERRPLHGMFSAGPPLVDKYDILKVATHVLETSLLKQMDIRLAPWGWHTWAKWYALAVALAELCGPARGEQVDKAWSVVEATFPQSMDIVVDYTLRRSLEKLLARARSARDKLQTPADSLEPLLDRALPLPEFSGVAKLHNRGSLAPQKDSDFQEQIPHRIFNDDGIVSSSESVQPNQQSALLVSSDWTHGDFMDGGETLPWINWELFMQDVSTSYEPSILNPSSYTWT